MKEHIFDVSLKKIGMLKVDNEGLEMINSEAYKEYIKVLYLTADCKIKVDFQVYNTSGSSLFFISPNQVLSI